MADEGIVLYCVGCEPSISAYCDFYKALALITGGRYVPLKRAHLLKDVIVGGVSEELALQCLADDLEEEVSAEVDKLQEELTEGGEIDVNALVCKLQEKLQIDGRLLCLFTITEKVNNIYL